MAGNEKFPGRMVQAQSLEFEKLPSADRLPSDRRTHYRSSSRSQLGHAIKHITARCPDTKPHEAMPARPDSPRHEPLSWTRHPAPLIKASPNGGQHQIAAIGNHRRFDKPRRTADACASTNHQQATQSAGRTSAPDRPELKQDGPETNIADRQSGATSTWYPYITGVVVKRPSGGPEPSTCLLTHRNLAMTTRAAKKPSMRMPTGSEHISSMAAETTHTWSFGESVRHRRQDIANAHHNEAQLNGVTDLGHRRQ